jgi:hypothetical protein
MFIEIQLHVSGKASFPEKSSIKNLLFNFCLQRSQKFFENFLETLLLNPLLNRLKKYEN